MPRDVTGSWRISRILPTHNAACWGNEQARPLLGTTLRYRPGAMHWKGGDVAIAEALSRTLTGSSYLNEYKVSLAELGIHATSATEIDLQHEDADITGATTEVPGDTVLLAGPNRIIVSACGVYFEALRSRNR